MGEGTRSPGALPKSVGRYQIQGSLGVGAMGAVYKGFDPLIKRTLAIKTIRLDIPRGTEEYRTFLERFYQEARISGTLAHPNIVTLFDIGEDNGLPFLALEFIEGQTLEKKIGDGERFAPERVLAIARQVASALDYAHSKGIIHRDIKPANVMLFDDDRVKITDFGIAKLADSDMTRQGQLLGTPSYMSPEQAMGEKLDGRSDIFSLGIVSFEMLSGQQPFQGNNVTAILYKLVNAEPLDVDPAALAGRGLVPEKWQQVFKKVLAKRRDDRYQTAEEFVNDLELCLGASGGFVQPAAGAAQPQAEPSVVISLDEVTAAMPMPSPPEEEDDLPQTIALPAPRRAPQAAPPQAAAAPDDDEAHTVAIPSPAFEAHAPEAAEEVVDEDELPATVAISRPTMPEDEDELPATIAMPRPAMPSDPASQPPGKPKVVMPSSFRGAIGTTRVRLPPKSGAGPSSRPPGSRTVPPGTRSVPPGTRSVPPGTRSVPPGAGSIPPSGTAGVTSMPPARPGLPLALLGGGAALLVAALVVGFLALRGGGAAGGGGAIDVQSQPPGAVVSLNGEPIEGVTPTTLRGLAPGSYTVALELADHDAQEVKVELADGALEAKVDATLKPSSAEQVEVDILSRPAGATVFVDGVRVGQTPMRDFRVRAGVRRFRIATEDYLTWTTLATVAPGKAQRIDARLEPRSGSPAGEEKPASGR
jgi:serine/threonine-protein kinase